MCEFHAVKLHIQKRMVNFEKDVLPLSPLITGIASRYTKSNEMAEDVLQNVLVRMWKNHDLRSGSELKSLAAIMAKNASIDLIKKESKYIGSDMSEDVEDSRMFDDYSFDSMLDRFEGNDRIILELYYKEGMTFPEIGYVVGRTDDYVRHRHNSLLKKMKVSV